MEPKIYRVTLDTGVTHDVPAATWRDDCMLVGNTYTPDNCLWWDDVLDGLRDAVPPGGEFAAVEVL